jgi:carbamoyltransferase
MRILGVNKGFTRHGKALKDGGAALYTDGQLVAIAEERVTGVKHQGGFENAVNHLKGAGWLEPDVIAISTCCEPSDGALVGHALEGDPRLVAVGHHDSHAALAYFMSGFDSALVVVADGGGNTYGAAENPEHWWTSQREQMSFYEAAGGSMALIDRDFFEPFEAGLAEIYRVFTYYLGWHSYVYASRTMALAGTCADPEVARWPPLFQLDNGHLRSPIANDPLHPIDMVQEIAKVFDLPLGAPRAPSEPINATHGRVAAYVQRCLEEALIARISSLVKATGMRNVCLSGGVALNAVSNARLAGATGCRLFVPSAPGDDGQAVGNLLAVLQRNTPPRRRRVPETPFLGPARALGSAAVAEVLRRGQLAAIVLDGGDVPAHIATEVAHGALVCLYQGRSEFGPRALGHRSILGDPRRADTAVTLNNLKQRPAFMPFAPVMRASAAARIFCAVPESPYMSFAPVADQDFRDSLAGVVHADGTSRVQILPEEDDSTLARAITLFGAETGVAALLNTSFNRGGGPIVETPDQAVAAFKELAEVPSLVLDRFIILRDGAWPARLSLDRLVIRLREGHEREYRLDADRDRQLRIIEHIRAATGSVIFARSRLPLLRPYVRLLESGAKITTIRFRRGGIELPSTLSLPVVENKDARHRNEGDAVGVATIAEVGYCRFGDLDEADARRDGFENVQEMRKALTGIYSCLKLEDWVSIFRIEAFTNGGSA